MMFKKLRTKKSINSKDILAVIFSLIITSIFLSGYYFLGNKFTEVMWIINLLVLATPLAVIAITASFAVLRTLFLVAAELSLLIFLAQSFCAVPIRADVSNEALKTLIAFSVLYIAYLFAKSLYELFKENWSIFGKKWTKSKVFFSSFFLIYTGIFIWQIYLVISPILLNLCVFSP